MIGIVIGIGIGIGNVIVIVIGVRELRAEFIRSISNVDFKLSCNASDLFEVLPDLVPVPDPFY